MGHLQRGASGHLLRTASGHLANECSVTCDCEGHGPITATITVTGGCDCGPASPYYCENQVLSLAWDGSNQWWQGSSDFPTVDDSWPFLRVWCTGGSPDTWTIKLVGGCGLMAANTTWQKTFTPEGCERDNGDGYPTHSGIDMGTPIVDDCWDDCAPTVALS